jgi:alpha 1,2-mannosyltransferase
MMTPLRYVFLVLGVLVSTAPSARHSPTVDHFPTRR